MCVSSSIFYAKLKIYKKNQIYVHAHTQHRYLLTFNLCNFYEKENVRL